MPRPLTFVAGLLGLASCLASCSSPPNEEKLAEAASAVGRFPEVAEKDLAIAFPLLSGAPILARDRVGGETLLPRAVYSAVSAAFGPTDVGDALDSESLYEDWRLVSARVAPCAALAPSPRADVERLCWPEVRLVFQPVVFKVTVHARFSPAFADDRAMHALYDAPPELALGTADAARARALLARVASYTATWAGGPFAPLSATEIAEFESLRDRVVTELLTRLRATRGAGIPAGDFRALGLRPETDTVAGERALRGSMLAFLGATARPSRMKALTAFSLPAGREPAHIDAWVFLSFRVEQGVPRRERLRLVSRVDGRTVADIGTSATGTMGADDVAFHGMSDPEIADSIVRRRGDIARLTPVLRDRRERLVPNTGCASCHQMNALLFDFHNFGYLEDRDLTISPRVATDVELDLAWLARR